MDDQTQLSPRLPPSYNCGPTLAVVSESTAAKLLPEKCLGLGRLAPQLSGALSVTSHHSTPSPLAPHPSPSRGEGNRNFVRRFSDPRSLHHHPQINWGQDRARRQAISATTRARPEPRRPGVHRPKSSVGPPQIASRSFAWSGSISTTSARICRTLSSSVVYRPASDRVGFRRAWTVAGGRRRSIVRGSFSVVEPPGQHSLPSESGTL